MTTTLNQAGRYCNHLWSDGTYRFIEEVVYIPTPSTYYPTYAERTHTVDPSAVIDGVGDDASPWTSEQARTLAVAGNKVGIKSGVIVGIDPEAGGNSRFTPAFLPLNSGTVDNKIYFIAEHPAADPNTDPSDYTEFRSGATVAGSGWPAFGTLDNNYVEYIGFYTDETRSNNKGTNDSGPCTLWTAIGCGVHLCRIIGEDAPFDDNHNGIRIEGFEYGHISSNHIEGFKNNIVSSAINQSGITTYRTLHTIIEHNYFKDCGESVYIKGGYQYGNIARFNRIEGAVWNGMRILSLEPDPLDGDNRNQIYQNLFINCANDIELGYHGDRPLANNAVDIFNNTCYAQSADNSSFSLYIRDDVEVRGNTFRNNVVHVIGRKSYLGVESAAWNAADFTNYVNTDSNTYYGTAVFADGYNASDWNQADFATWKVLTGADGASQIADPLFVDAANGDFRLQAGSPALNAGTDYTNVKGGGTSAPINHGAYVSPDQSEIIGINLNGYVSIEGLQLAYGHYVPQVYNMASVFPRPDEETGLFAEPLNAKHRWAYYDGTNDVRYEFPIKIFGGSAPHRYTILSGPTGATVGNDFGDPNSHGVIKWTPDRAYTTSAPASFVVRVTGQDGLWFDIDWTVATSIDKFLFLSNSGNDTTGTGSFAAPFATLSKVMGATTTEVTYPDKFVVMRAGSYATVAHSDCWNGGNAGETIPARVELSASNHPYVYMSYPDEEVTIDFSGGELNLDDSDFCLTGTSTGRLIVSGSSDNAAETHNIWLFPNASRVLIAFVDFDGFIPRVAGNFTNSVPIFASESNVTPVRKHLALHNVREINRVASSDNDALLFVLFGLDGHCDEYCSAARASGSGVTFKDTCFNTSSRYMEIDTGANDTTYAFTFMGQTGSANQEICYSFLRGPLYMNLQANASTQKLVEYRNTVFTTDSNYSQAVRAWPAVGPYESTNSVLISNGAEIVNSNVTAAGTECHVVAASADLPIDPVTGLLVNNSGLTQYRDLYLGIRGWEIA